MNMEQRLDDIERETVALMLYLDGRKLRPDVGLSALISALMLVVGALDLPMDIITTKLTEANAMRKDLLSSEGKVVH